MVVRTNSLQLNGINDIFSSLIQTNSIHKYWENDKALGRARLRFLLEVLFYTIDEILIEE